MFIDQPFQTTLAAKIQLEDIGLHSGRYVRALICPAPANSGIKFRRIDVDMSNEVEFDEFVQWVREDEVRVAGAAPLQKMSFEELAVVYGESIELIKYIYDRFQDSFPPEEKDGYPKNPKSLPKAQVRALVSMLAPEMSNGADFNSSGGCFGTDIIQNCTKWSNIRVHGLKL